MSSIYDNFLNHLRNCGGCLGPREKVNCRFKIACATAEKLAQKGLVKNSKELRLYGHFETKKYDKHYVCDN